MWDDPYWRGRREARAYGPYWTGYFATIRANILRDIAARTGLRLDESQLSTDIKQSIREVEEFYHQCYTKLDEARKLREGKKTGNVTVIVLTIIGLTLFIPGVVGGIVFSGLASLGWYTVAVIGAVFLVFALLGYATLVIEGEKKAKEKERESCHWQTLVQVKIEGISKEIKDQALRSPKLSA
jgi:VIT1/CCC1 family predicted Fe2+/Mn2+ transporter